MKMSTLTTLDNTIDAHLLKHKLESEGIISFLINENFTNLFPCFYGVLGGGVKIMVNADDLLRARHVANLAGDSIVCPQCGSESVKLMNRYVVGAILMLFGVSGNLLTRFKCDRCGSEFNR